MAKEQKPEFAPLNRKRPEQPNLRRWHQVLADLAVEYPAKGTARPLYRIFRDPASPRPVQMLPIHFLTWSVLVVNADSLSGTSANTWHAEETHCKQIGQSAYDFKVALHDLEHAVRIIATENRPGRNTNAIHIFTTPLDLGETWQMREATPVRVPGVNLDAQTETSDEVEPEHEEGSSEYPPEMLATIVGAILAAFHNPPCLADEKSREKLARQLPPMIKKAGTPPRLWALFRLIALDNSTSGIKLQRCLDKAKNGSAYLGRCINDWLDDRSQAIDAYIANLKEEPKDESESEE